MLLRMSQLFVRTLRDDPADAEVPSHRLLVRAGYVRRIAPGIFSWLPLGYIVYRNIESIVRDEMDHAGFQEVHFPALLPREPYERTHRWEEYGDNLFRLHDRKGGDYLLGPTHEEMFTLMVKGEYSSYKDLPLVIYQIQTKYRDEARPRAGILRGREFVMKDSYSFDVDDAGLERSYLRHRDAYISCFARLGLDFVIVSAQSGAMGGSQSEEFLAPTDSGEDTYVRCTACDYAANVEAFVTAPIPAADMSALPAAQVHNTPDTPTIATLVDVSNARADLRHPDRDWTAGDTLKNVVFMADYPDGSSAPLAIGVPGDREVDVKRLEAALHPVALRPFEETDFPKYPALVKGYIGPGALGGEANVRYRVDPRVAVGTAWITGANDQGRHVYGLVRGRDFDVDGEIEAVEIVEGDPCPRCGADIEIARGIEIGHIFQLGRKYADAFGLDVLGPDSKPVRVTMGSYGIGVSRAIAAIAEQSYDEKGLVWPREVAPFDVHVVGVGKGEQKEVAERIAGELEQRGLTVLLDDRPKVSPGVAFKDAELIGVPTSVVIGRGLETGEVELRDRRSGESRTVALEGLVDTVLAEVRP